MLGWYSHLEWMAWYVHDVVNTYALAHNTESFRGFDTSLRWMLNPSSQSQKRSGHDHYADVRIYGCNYLVSLGVLQDWKMVDRSYDFRCYCWLGSYHSWMRFRWLASCSTVWCSRRNSLLLDFKVQTYQTCQEDWLGRRKVPYPACSNIKGIVLIPHFFLQ